MSAPPVSNQPANQESWHGLRPGMTRAEVLSAIARAGIDPAALDSDPIWILVAEWSMELRFEEGGQERLRQISSDDETLTWNGQPLINMPLHQSLLALGDLAASALWSPGDAVNEPLDGSAPAREGPVTDETLLSEGSVWFPAQGLALALGDGLVGEIVWRRAEDLPKKFEGPVTAAQLALSARPELTTYLRDQQRARLLKEHRQRMSWTPLQWMVVLFTIIVMASIARQAWLETQRWQQALTVQGNLAAIEIDAGKLQEKTYRIQFKDAQGNPQTRTLRAGDFYVPPREIGEEVPLFYVADRPQEMRGPAHARDAAFLRYLPWVGAAALFHILAMLVAGFVSKRKPVVVKPAALNATGPGVAKVTVIE